VPEVVQPAGKVAPTAVPSKSCTPGSVPVNLKHVIEWAGKVEVKELVTPGTDCPVIPGSVLVEALADTPLMAAVSELTEAPLSTHFWAVAAGLKLAKLRVAVLLAVWCLLMTVT